MKKNILAFCILLGTFCISYAQPGSLDTTFGIGGKVLTDFGNSDDVGFSTAIQSDGKIVVAGYKGSCIGDGCNNSFALARYNSDGTLDNTFGSGGKVTTAVGNAGDYSMGYSVAIQSDGKIVVAGYIGINLGGYDFALVRYNSDGSLDNSFGSGGKVTTGIRGYDFGLSVAIQNDGKIVVAGGSLIGITCNTSDFTLVRYNSDGTLDNTFGSGGKVTTAVGSYDDEAYSVVIQNDGKIVVAGGNGVGNGNKNLFALVRYNNDGGLDNTFGSGGKVLTDFGNDSGRGNSVTILNDGKIVVAGYSFNNGSPSYTDFTLVRYNNIGSLDSTFGTDGKVLTDFGSSHDVAYSVAIQSDGKIVVAGLSYNGTNPDFALVRYHSNGHKDNTFGSGGQVTTAIGDSTDVGYSVAIQGDGKIVVAGLSYNGTDYDFAVARYNSDVLNNDTILTPIEEAGRSNSNGSVEIYPNPTRGKFQVQSSKVQCEKIEIYNELGEKVFSSQIKNPTFDIDISSQPKGIYFVEMIYGNERRSKKIILE